MATDDSDTLIDYEELIAQPPELLAKRREQFLLFRRIARLCLAGLLLLLFALLTYLWSQNESAARWATLPIPAVVVLLMLGLERVQFCSECNALMPPAIWAKPAWCPNCCRLLDPAQVLLHAPGTIDLTDERYRSNGQPVVKLIAMVFLLGIKDRATEIRFEPGRDSYRLSFRCNGQLFELVPPPLHLHKSISGTLKAMAGLDPARSESAQAGQISIQLGDDHTVAVRVDAAPGEFGENVVVWLPESVDLDIHDATAILLDKFMGGDV